MQQLLLLSALHLAKTSPTSSDTCCWCDPDTPNDKRTFVDSDSQINTLVFSDEFNDKTRNFQNGKDQKWTALEVGDTSNKGAAFYLPEQATVVQDKQASNATKPVFALRIATINESHTGDSPTGETGIEMPYKSAMLQSWNKFCFTGGVVEFRARSPRGAGYWPALWAFGNLGRAVYQNSNTGLWPWSYDQCDASLDLPPSDPPQRISACMNHSYERDGLHPFQGRGATEIDVLEGAVTNSGNDSYSVGSLQLSPGIPAYFRPPMFGFPTTEGSGAWYSGLEFGPRGLPNNGWYGPPWGSDCPTGCPDALSGGLTKINDFDTRYWTYRMEWKTGPDGGIKWFYDNEFVWSIGAEAFDEYSVCSNKPGEKSDCKRTPKRQVPQEPMSLVMNTAIGTWNGGASALDGKHWPAEFYIDYVRVWQSETNVGCDPPDYPTKKYIEKNAELYGEPVSPLGSDTCPEIYPESAYKHADEIYARAQSRATVAKTVQQTLLKEEAKTLLTTPADSRSEATERTFSTSGLKSDTISTMADGTSLPKDGGLSVARGGSSLSLLESASILGCTVVAMVLVVRRVKGRSPQRYDPFPTAEVSPTTEYELAT